MNNGNSSFSNKVYVAYQQIKEVLKSLNIFKTHIHGGLLDLLFGEFGPEYANGAFHARFTFKEAREYLSPSKCNRISLTFARRMLPVKQLCT
jgi:hypothetical protein